MTTSLPEFVELISKGFFEVIGHACAHITHALKSEDAFRSDGEVHPDIRDRLKVVFFKKETYQQTDKQTDR